MRAVFRKDFKKQLARLSVKKQELFFATLSTFCDSPHDPELHDHPLNGMWKGYRSIDVDGDLRAVYKIIADGIACFVAIGTHHQLYGN